MRVNYIASSGTTPLQGVAELKKALDELSSEVATKIGYAANRKATGFVFSIVKAAAPYRPGVQKKYRKTSRGSTSQDYGDLRDNLKIRKARSRKETAVVYNITTGNAFWGFFQEYGTSRQPAYPWMRPAVDAARAEAVNIQIDELGKGITRAAKRAAKANRAVLPNGRNA